MTTPLPQVRRGYVRGIRGFVVVALDAAGVPAVPAVSYGVRTAQQVGIAVETEAGEAAVHRGGDSILARIKDPDTVVGLTLTLQDARFDARAIQLIAGGTLITIVEGPNTRINGWEAPTLAAQQNPPRFRLEAYSANYNSQGAIDGFVKYTFPFCRATFGNQTLQDQTWAIPELNVECAEPPAGGGLYRIEFVPVLPTELS